MNRNSGSILKYIFLVTLLLLVHRGFLHGLEPGSISLDYRAVKDSNSVNKDAFRTRMIRDFHWYRIKIPLHQFKINWLKNDFKLKLKDKAKKITESELYEIYSALYAKYYNNRIELYNLNGSAFIYLNLKEAQTKQGAIQLQFDLSRFNKLFKQKRTSGK